MNPHSALNLDLKLTTPCNNIGSAGIFYACCLPWKLVGQTQWEVPTLGFEFDGRKTFGSDAACRVREYFMQSQQKRHGGERKLKRSQPIAH